MYKRDKAQIDRIRNISLKVYNHHIEAARLYNKPQDLFDFEDDIFEEDIVREPKKDRKRPKVVKIY